MGSLGEDVRSELKEVGNALVKMDDFFGNLEEVDYDTLCSKMTPVDRAKYDITIAYTINSLYWMIMRSMGENPKDHKITEELDRIKTQMARLKQVTDKAKRPQVDKDAAGRMIRHGINQSKSRKRKAVSVDENWEEEEPQTASGSKSNNSK